MTGAVSWKHCTSPGANLAHRHCRCSYRRRRHGVATTTAARYIPAAVSAGDGARRVRSVRHPASRIGHRRLCSPRCRLPIYASRLVATPAVAPRFAAFDWGGTGFAGVGEPDIYMVYDESDDTANGPSQRTKRRVFKNTGSSRRLQHNGATSGRGDQCFVVRHMVGHFYRVQYWYNM